jgi:hypothetical protein
MKPLNWGFGVSIFGIIIMDKYMKNKYFNIVLLALGLVFATSSMSVITIGNNPPSSSNYYEDVYLHTVTARYTSDTTFEVYIRADENMNFITSARPVIYNALMKDGNKYVNATITLHDDDGTGTDEIKIVVSGLDFSSVQIFNKTIVRLICKHSFPEIHEVNLRTLTERHAITFRKQLINLLYQAIIFK